jgi:S-formylglutathione hydrolase FrmB
MRYETYVSHELVDYVDDKFNTIEMPEGRAIAGLSMGGHGALYLYFRHQDIFGSAGSMSGGVDLRPFPNNWDLAKRLGSQDEYPENWEKHSVINQLHRMKNHNPSIIIDCGIDDFFIDVNRKLHKKLQYLNIKHDYIERPGKHNWDYWDNALQYQVLFFNNFFQSKLKNN